MLLLSFYFLIGLLCRAKSMSELHYREELDAFDPSDWKVEMKCATIEEEEGVNIF